MRIAMIAITTNSSISVKPERRHGLGEDMMAPENVDWGKAHTTPDHPERVEPSTIEDVRSESPVHG
jgi:hypothetical protein